MKLYDGGRAPNPRRVQIFLKEKGIELNEVIQLDLNNHDHRTSEMTLKNPTQTVPFLELDDGTILSETIAICRYFENLNPEPSLFGQSPLEQAIIEMWNRRVEFGFFAAVAQSFRHLHPGAAVLEGEQIEAWGLKNKVKANDYMPILNDQLSRYEFIAGDRFSVADITLFVACQFMKPARIEMPDEMEHLKRWFAAISERPSTTF